ncbi:topoisomerase DNA-binding C4 zinc finger domain-containing protein [Ruminococcus sp.]|uniref:topoisomerase DNA-binding C4 zinc finger domain-containing protein n=1 Tax=Ruminococcus sp. TaxID=41978 RepID=UPI0025F89FBD|nr:topoisomerase DNA-binding C4 zinc finger domain-containing protein [Ruminococcus sp.]
MDLGKPTIDYSIITTDKQNNSHIKWLSKYLAYYTSFPIPFYSFIVFSDRCELKRVPPDSPEAVICYRDELYRKVCHLWDYFPFVFSEADVETTYNLLYRLTNVSEALKQAHINSVYRAKSTRYSNPPQYNNYHNQVPHYSNTVPNTAPRCQRCGSPLVIRTVKEGYNTGKQFYGCSKYPQCKYTQNL